jgi:hypothetical protein
MQSSESINELATALAKAQGEITGALKDSENPFFKSKYADLASCWDACREPLSKNGLSVVQPAEVDEQGVVVTTMLMHTSGQWIKSALRMIPKDGTPQSVGSGIAYGRRYGLTAMIGIAQVDDDGNAASGRTNSEIHSQKGDLGRNVDPERVFKESAAMRDLLQMDGDVDHKIVALKIYDKHLVLAKDNDFYEAASKGLTAEERKNWKAYVTEAKELEKEDRAVANVGRRF